jgi:hypothetical protein
MIIVFHSLFNCQNRSIISSEVFVSSAHVGSSASIIFGEITSALAIATLCFCPPDISFGRLFSFPLSQTFLKASRANPSAFLLEYH